MAITEGKKMKKADEMFQESTEKALEAAVKTSLLILRAQQKALEEGVHWGHVGIMLRTVELLKELALFMGDNNE
jgi:hypothetical protein